MSIENFCEFVKQTHADPFKKSEDLSTGDMIALQQHIQVCNECARLVDEVIERFQDVKPDPNYNDGRFN